MKTLQNTIAAVALATLLISSNVFAQSNASAIADVKIQLKKGLSIASSRGIDFGEIVLSSGDNSQSISASDGAMFQVVGHPGKSVAITYSNVSLDNDAWVTTNGGTKSTLELVTNMDETGKSESYSGANSVAKLAGTRVNLVNNLGTGYLNLWVGGTMTIDGTQAHGDYTGEMTVSVVY